MRQPVHAAAALAMALLLTAPAHAVAPLNLASAAGPAVQAWPATAEPFPVAAPAAVARAEAPPALQTLSLEQLPPEAVQTLQLIMSDGPFPFRQDGSVFGNFEKRLPVQARGYYREYTVSTPWIRHRGARRIVAGGDPRSRGEFYYSDDHYQTFRRIVREKPP